MKASAWYLLLFVLAVVVEARQQYTTEDTLLESQHYGRSLLQECQFTNKGVYVEIFGGVDAPVGRFPYMISIQVQQENQYKHHCGGTLISPELILTAAHCIYIKVSNGAVDLRRTSSLQGELDDSPALYAVRVPLCRHQDGEGGRIRITGYYLSGDYKGGPLGGGDIAILKTETPFDYSGPFINFDTSSVNYEGSNLFTALGYGATDILDFRSRAADLVPLQLGFFSYEDDYTCQARLFEFNSAYKLVPESNICFGYKAVDTCQGDSGGPMILADDNYGLTTNGDPSKDVQVGITSWGPVIDCSPGDSGAPGVYTKLANYHEWIKSVLDSTVARAPVPMPASPPPSECVERVPPGDWSCEDQKRFEKCGADWMLQGGYCKKTCDLCDVVLEARSRLQCFGEPAANYRGVIVKIGMQNIQPTIEDCCLSCDIDPDCNVWVYCPRKEGCRNLDEVLDYGRCDLKYQAVVSRGGIPQVYYRGNETDFTSGYILGKSQTNGN